jgi:hypothetical protein
MSDPNNARLMAPVRATWIAAVLFVACAFAGWGVFGRGLAPDSVVRLDSIRELSGIDYRDSTGTLWAISDNSTLYEIDPDGKILRRLAFKDGDTEGVLEFSTGGKVWVLSERQPALFVVRASDLSFEGSINLERYPRAENKNKQFEGMALTADDRRLILANERPAVLVEMDVDENGRPGPILSTVEIDADSLSAIAVSPDGREICIVSRDVGLRLVTRAGRPLGPWKKFRASRIEGMAFVPGRGLCLASDTTPSRISYFKELDSWEKLRAFLVEK